MRMRNSGKSTATPLSCDGLNLHDTSSRRGTGGHRPAAKTMVKPFENHPEPSKNPGTGWSGWLIWLVDLHQTWRWEWDVLTPPLWKFCRYPILSPKDSHHQGWGDCATWRSRTSCEMFRSQPHLIHFNCSYMLVTTGCRAFRKQPTQFNPRGSKRAHDLTTGIQWLYLKMFI